MALLRFSDHVEVVMRERGIEREWVARAIASPAWTSSDPSDAALVRAFAQIVERGDRVLRVVYRPDGDAVFVVTAFFDRGARRP